MVGIDGSSDYAALLGMLKDDYGKQIIHMSDSCNMDFPPDPAFQISLSYVISGLPFFNVLLPEVN